VVNEKVINDILIIILKEIVTQIETDNTQPLSSKSTHVFGFWNQMLGFNNHDLEELRFRRRVYNSVLRQ